MTITDHHDIFIGSTSDGWTFLLLNRRIHHATPILAGAGFTAREHRGRTVYLLPPETSEDAHESVGVAAYGLMSHTHDLVDLAWTTRPRPAGTTARPDVNIGFHDGSVTASATTDQAQAVLAQHGFTNAGTDRDFTLPDRLGEADAMNTVVRAEAHLFLCGVSVRVDLGIATVQDIPPAPPRARSAPIPPSPPRGRSR
ncbi:hypothetical protein ACWDYK_01650 [Streptomyces anthocyanicus]|uniref:Uncharacterized protein n=1 Tax=Streptomyces lividans 1326 TaxID=1200984 RepID=A0A7U9DKP8_STRLI|nr:MULTISPECIES: hypothetical protein [Streptomyces]EOY45734.1 hypothetical protein SLI_1017 [Streptomyces lividans 1326]KKD10181.1 hypothetical protein TR66_37660 [Streptomyces sp. WM6391]